MAFSQFQRVRHGAFVAQGHALMDLELFRADSGDIAGTLVQEFWIRSEDHIRVAVCSMWLANDGVNG